MKSGFNVLKILSVHIYQILNSGLETILLGHAFCDISLVLRRPNIDDFHNVEMKVHGQMTHIPYATTFPSRPPNPAMLI